MKKKILVVEYQMSLGGVCVAVSNFIANLKDDYDIDLYLSKEGGELDNRLPENVNINYIGSPLNTAHKSRRECKNLGIKIYLQRSFCGVLNRYLKMSKTAINFLLKRTPVPTEEVDVVVNNEMDVAERGLGCCHPFAKKVKAKQKFLIIHGDFVGNNYSKSFFEKEYLPVYDKVILVTEAQVKQMCELFPKYSKKFVCVPNFEDNQKILEMADEFKVGFPNDRVNFVSVSRLTEVKGIFRTLKQVVKLKDEGYKFCWHIIGDGEQKEGIEKFIEDNKLEGFVELCGYKKNPYPYMKAADFSTLLSFHEAYGLVAIESLICKTPILMTKTIAAEEMITDKEGIICENSDEGVYLGLKQMLDSYKKYKSNVKNYVFDNKSIKEKFKDLVNEKE